MNHSLYYIAVQADDAFQRELIRVYGIRFASEKRYQLCAHADDALEAAHQAKAKADLAWYAEQRGVSL
jgi:hypothetical protein